MQISVANMKNYREEIDGLRAIAVLSVIFFHADFSFFKGGFVGVDIFFVISGYLITNIIISEINTNQFSIFNFYERRIRRIIPALYFVMFVSIPFAWAWMIPGEMKDYANSLLTVPIFSSNFLFWRDQVGYLADEAQLKPLIHTWSLAVEEQYYLLFPIPFLFFWKTRFRLILSFFVIIFLVSFMLAEWASVHKPVAGFLLLPTRIWEFLSGGFVALLIIKKITLPKIFAEFFGVTGLFMIFYSIFSYSESLPYPSHYTLLPVIGSVFVLLFANRPSFTGSFLGLKVFTTFGLISYSAYLWHQPIFAFAKNRTFTHDPSINLFIFLCFITFCLAFFTWHFVEKPFRSKHFIPRSRLYFFILIITIFFFVFGLFGRFTDGFKNRFSDNEQRLLFSIDSDNVNKIMRDQGLNQCFSFSENLSDLLVKKCISFDASQKRVIIFGDSHAAHLSSGVRSYFPKLGYTINQLTMPGCSFIFPATNYGKCLDLYNVLNNKLVPTLTKNDILVISINWRYGYQPNSEREFKSHIQKAFTVFRGSLAKIIIVGAPPCYRHAPQSISVRNGSFKDNNIYLEPEKYIFMNSINKILGEQSKIYGFEFIDPTISMCNDLLNKNCFVKKNGRFLYLDHGHLSEEGSLQVIGQLFSIKSQ